MNETFENRDLAGAVFRKVNLQGAVLDDVNLAGASIKDANLKDLTIEDAYIKGMTVFGFRVDDLIEAELDRRDRERVRLRLSDPHDPARVRAVMARLDEVRAVFCETLRSTDAELLATRPSPGQWSVIEIVRHLVFAEDLYLNRWIECNDVPWCAAGLLPEFLAHNPDYADVGSEPTGDLEDALAAWETIHRCTREFVVDATTEQLLRDTSELDFGQGTVGGILQGLAQHDLGHIRQAEVALDDLTGKSPAGG